ncbi:MAG: hypothetical protein J0M19_15070 [Sphingomonadales bacterium]|nr:hypothetical protein [Sphingomonadales bacterium]
MSRFANLADRVHDTPKPAVSRQTTSSDTPPSRIGRKAISGYFAPELSMALHHCARKHDLSLQTLMAEAFNDVLRKYGESPVGR